MKTKSHLFALLFSSLLLPTLSFGQTVIAYTTTGVLQVVSGSDKLGLGGSTVTVTNSLTQGQLPIGGTTNQYTTSATIADPAFPLGITLKNVAATVTINYTSPNSPTNGIALNASDSVFGLALTVVSNVFVPSVSSIGPEPISQTTLTSADTIVVTSNSGGETTYSFASGTISSVPANVCSYSVSPLSLDFPLAGNQQTVTVTAGSGCAWTASSNNPWITISPLSGTGSGVVTVTVQGNTTGAVQIGSAIVAGTPIAITQDGPLVCTFTVSPASLSYPSTGGSPQPLNISASYPTCTWTASSSLSWLSLSPTSGTGSGTVLATALPNAGTQNLVGNITVAGQTVPVSEAASNACSFTVAPSSLLFIANGGSATLTLSASTSTCAWTASFENGPGWLSVSPSSGTGSATVTVTAAGNGSGGVKNATLDIAGQKVTIQQSNTNACMFSVTSNPSPLNFVSSPSLGFITVNASGQSCPWSVSVNPDWLVPSTYTASGTLTISLQASANTGTTTRTGTITVAGVSFPVSQNGNAGCNFTVAPNTLQFTNNSGSAPLAFSVSDSTCAWTASSSQPWVSVSPSSGTGAPQQLTAIVQGNTTGQSRTATLNVAGVNVQVTQSSTGCTYTLSPTTLSFTSAGGPLPVTVTASNSSCAWTATSGLSFVNVVPAGATGTGAVTAIAATNLTNATESGSITIAGQVVPVTVAGGSGCTFTVSNASVLFPNVGGSTVRSVITSGVGCAWTASAPSWVTLSATAGTGSSSIIISAPGDQAGPSLAGSVILAGTSIPVSQAGGCTFTISPTSIAVDVRGILQPVTINANSPSCVWTATPPPFATLTATTGTGSGTTTLAIPYNSTGGDISGTMTIAGQTINVFQDFTQQVFQDVVPGDYDFDAVNLLSQKNITAGCGPAIFCPNASITRAQMAIFLVAAAYNGGPFTASATPYFLDVPANAFGFQWIQKMYELGLTTGCGNGNFCPNTTVTRDQASVFLIKSRYGPTTVFDFPPTPIFNDVPADYWAFSWIQRMSEDQITAGCGNGDFCPTAQLTRGQIAIFLMRAIYNAFAAPGTPEITSVVPNVLVPGTQTVAITGVNTAFVQGQTLLSAIPGVTISSVSVTSPTALTATLTVQPTAPAQPDAVFVITGTQEVVLPFGITVP